jgi:hypothetical protein
MAIVFSQVVPTLRRCVYDGSFQQYYRQYESLHLERFDTDYLRRSRQHHAGCEVPVYELQLRRQWTPGLCVSLQRSPDSGGLSYWLSALSSGSSRTAVRNGFAYSLEFQGNVVRLCPGTSSSTSTSANLKYVLTDLQGSARALMNNSAEATRPTEYKNLFDLPESQQEEKFAQFPIEKQVDIYTYAMYAEPPLTSYAKYLGKNGRKVLPVLLHRLEAETIDTAKSHLIYAFNEIHERHYSLKNERDTVESLRRIIGDMKDEYRRRQCIEYLKTIEDSPGFDGSISSPKL